MLGTTSTDAKRPPCCRPHPLGIRNTSATTGTGRGAECLFCLKRNEMMFDLEVDTDLIEQRIYERQALLCRYRYLLARARELGAAHCADEISAADMTGRFIGTKILTEGVGCVILVQDKCMVGQSPA